MSVAPIGRFWPTGPRSAERRDDVLAHQLDGLHDLVAGDVVRVEQAEDDVAAPRLPG
jgi:hypothetical protein